MWQEVTRGTGATFTELKDYEEKIAEGQCGRVDITLRLPMSNGIRGLLQNRLEQAGVEEVSTSTSGDLLRVQFRKGLLALALIVLAVLALAILVVSWRFYKEVVETIPKGLVITGAVVAIVLAVVFIIWLVGGRVRGGV